MKSTLLIGISKCLLLVLLSQVSGSSNNEPYRERPKCYFNAIYPKTVQSFSTYKIKVFVSNDFLHTRKSPDSFHNPFPTCSIKLHATIEDGPDNSFESKNRIESMIAGSSKTLFILVGNLTGNSSKLVLHQDAGHPYNWDIQEDLSQAPPGKGSKVPSEIRQILVETDKPFYKPGDTVRMRAVLLDKYLKPVQDGKLKKVEIWDPSKIVIKTWKKWTCTRGLWNGELELASEPPLGEWTIFVKAGEEVFTKRLFNVDKYVLPEWDINLIAPGYLLPKDIRVPFRVGVEAKYTYGLHVNGNCTIQVRLIRSLDSNEEENGFTPQKRRNSTTVEFQLSGSSQKYINLRGMQVPLVGDAFEVTVIVKENASGVTRAVSKNVTVVKQPYQIKVKERPDHKAILEGIPFNITFRVTTLDGVPVKDRSRNSVSVSLSSTITHANKGQKFKTTLADGGLVHLTLTFKIEFDAQARSSFSSKYEYLHFAYVEVSYKGVKLKHGLRTSQMNVMRVSVSNLTESKVTVRTVASQRITTLHYALVVDATIEDHKSIPLVKPSNDLSFSAQIPQDVDINHLVIYVFALEDGVLLQDAVFVSSWNRSKTKGEGMKVFLSKEKLRPGQNLTLRIETEPRSLVALKGVDKSLQLLGGAGKEWSELIRSEESAPMVTPFEAAGMGQMSNKRALRELQEYYGTAGVNGSGWGPIERQIEIYPSGANNPTSFDAPPPPEPLDPSEARKNFPDTWLWEDLEVTDESGVLEINRTVAETLNSWVITGYSLNAESPIGIMETPLEFRTFKPFFLTLPLPYSVIMGEVLTLQILIHNNLPTNSSTDVTVVFKNTEGAFEFIDFGKLTRPEARVSFWCPPKSVSTANFKIKPLQFGKLAVEVQAFSGSVKDGVSRTLLVEPPGRRVSRSTSLFLTPSNGQALEHQLQVAWPSVIVRGTKKLALTLVSNIMESSFENLDHLIQLPVSCGEQNMLNFVVDILALDYMEATKTNKPDIKEKALKYLESGYQRQLNYRHADDSFSAFGNSDPRGSTWLTAFVVRSFIKARKYVDIDKSIIHNGLSFLRDQLQPDGSFLERGRILNSAMQGDSSSGNSSVALTAYCLLALLEADGETFGSFSLQINSALGFLKQNTQSIEDDAYTLALAAYALRQSAPHKQQNTQRASHSVLQKLRSLAEPKVGGGTIWTRSDNKRGGKEVDPVSIETTAYALLTYLAWNHGNESLPLVNWLVDQRGEDGGFLSSQDTVVGLTALAKFAESSNAAAVDPNIQVAVLAGKTKKTLTIDGSNADTLQDIHLPKQTKALNLTVTGSGSVLAQLTWSYYIEDDPGKDSAFSITVKPSRADYTSSSNTNLHLDICTFYKGLGSSMMAIMEVSLPSGHVLNTENVEGLTELPNYRRHEVTKAGSHLSIYFDSLSSHNVTCARIQTYKAFEVEMPGASCVTVYDYYDTTKKAQAFYSTV